MSEPLVPLTFPLDGVRLIEASAGTGKTWTIAALYLRLVLGHGAPALWPPRILVVTFTRAATAELRERIRARLVEAATAMRGNATDDALLQELLASYANEPARADAARRLEIAAQWMDEAAIHTIDAWCQRMLAEHAVASRTPFGLTLVADETELVADAVRDYWRAEAYALDAAQAQALRAVAATPNDLARLVAPLLQRGGDARVVGIDAPAASLRDTIAQREAAIAALRDGWHARADALEALLHGLIDAKRVNGSMLQRRHCDPWIAHLHAWADGAEAEPLPVGKAADRLTRAGINEALKPGAPPLAHDASELLDTLAALPDALERLDLKPRVIAHALGWVRARLAAEKRRLAVAGFDDVKRRLADAVSADDGAPLRDAIAGQYPIALIDEFQDTDPAQWRLFRAIYAGRGDTGLFLIGDPKQAIYGFRGADIRTYLDAGAAARPPHYTLSTNHRSSAALVAAVNRVFAYGETWPRGAFAFDGALRFHDVEAAGRKTRFVDDARSPALTFWLHDDGVAVPSGAYQARMARACAAQIAAQLVRAGERRCGMVDAEGGYTPLAAADIAVLVRNVAEARAMQSALADRGLRCVYLSDRDSVFASDEARDMLRWLRAVAEPGVERPLRAALATATLGLSWDELDRLNRDEVHWEACVERFRDLHRLWRGAGVLAMLQRLLHEFGVPARLLAANGGERALTNLLHLAELLQHAAQTLDGEAALVRHLAESIAWIDEAQTAEEAIVRLESDAGLVKLVTVHKSKGLEYPLVYLPFACSFKDASRSPYRLSYDADGALVVDLARADGDRDDDARLQEDLRVLYVALTRARYACWLGVAPVTRGQNKSPLVHRSALGYLLSGGEPIAAGGELAQRLARLAGDCDAIAVVAPPQSDAQVAPAAAPDLAPARRYQAAPLPRWWIASYSALRIGGEAAPAAPDTAGEDNLVEQAGADARVRGATPPAAAPDLPLADFPKGPAAGTFLHGLLEWAAEKGFARSATASPEAHDMIARRCLTRGWRDWIRPLDAWLPMFLRQPLALPGAEPVCLAALGDGDRYQAELEFWFEAHDVDPRRLDALVALRTLGGVERAPLDADRLNGMFKGFIDLVFEHDGRWYVADYKSNWLGREIGDYAAPALAASIAQHRYEMQYCLYLLAVHRQLRARLPDYDYDRHIGGAVYVYLRGVDGGAHGVHVERPPRALIEAMDALFAGQVRDGR
ncbi:exodeoxyribonuclease V subunit beta [Tahibacter soli]|uniref:RecBCD enzyme subunit RecB n=1 Tax=Tahibacter soli TaxID=2983605 RepID=A0A9X3YIY9_9GAMM|nr:exodeoxyribonuclease V subunit beta [Tahibacter soli]MDC8013224.1 exodeoxyribonuclease V subunit beta [Tahibacter soli]